MVFARVRASDDLRPPWKHKYVWPSGNTQGCVLISRAARAVKLLKCNQSVLLQRAGAAILFSSAILSVVYVPCGCVCFYQTCSFLFLLLMEPFCGIRARSKDERLAAFCVLV